MTHMKLSDTIEVESKPIAGFHGFEITQDDGEGKSRSVLLLDDEMDGLINFAKDELGQ